MTMDYDSFMKDWTLYEDDESSAASWKHWNESVAPIIFGDNKDTITGVSHVADAVNRPAHYTKGSQEAIVTIEDAIADAPSNKAGFLQGQSLKYLLRLWHKGNSVEDAQKARWYLNRLIETLN